MKKIELTFPNGAAVKATLLEREEPELCKSLWNFIADDQLFVCHNTLSTGGAFAAFPRPSRSPNTEFHLANPAGRHKIRYIALKPGNLLWSGSRLYVVYGPCTEPTIAGAVTARIDIEFMNDFKGASENVWHHTYFFHKAAFLRVGRGETDCDNALDRG